MHKTKKNGFAIFGESEDIDNTGYNRTDSRWELESEIQQRWKDGYDLLEIEIWGRALVCTFWEKPGPEKDFFLSDRPICWNGKPSRVKSSETVLSCWTSSLETGFGTESMPKAMKWRTAESAVQEISMLLQRDIKNNWDDGYELLDIEYGEEQWYAVFAKK